jgi:hypothetical protein
MNYAKILKKLITTGYESSDYIFNVLLHNVDKEVVKYCIDALINDGPAKVIHKNDVIWFDPKDNMYDLDEYIKFKDRMIDANLMNRQGHMKGKVLSDTNYRGECNPYAPEYKVEINVNSLTFNNENLYNDDIKNFNTKEIRVKRQNICGIVEPEDLV